MQLKKIAQKNFNLFNSSVLTVVKKVNYFETVFLKILNFIKLTCFHLIF